MGVLVGPDAVLMKKSSAARQNKNDETRSLATTHEKESKANEGKRFITTF